jgi:YD repeat-containing protein
VLLGSLLGVTALPAYAHAQAGCAPEANTCAAAEAAPAPAAAVPAPPAERTSVHPERGAAPAALLSDADSGAAMYAAPVIDTSPQSPDYGLVDAAAAHLSFTTPAYVSRDQPRSITLYYSSASTASRGFVQVDATDNSSQAPTKMSIRVKAPNGSWWTDETYYQGATGTSRLGVSWDMSAGQTGTYDCTVVVRSYFSDGSMTETSAPVQVQVITRDFAGWAGLAPGWMIAGQQRVRTGSAASILWLTNGDGTIERFTQDVTGTYRGPAHDPTTLAYDGNGYIVRQYPDGGTVRFSAASGEMQQVADRFGNTTTWNYDSAWRLISVVDPAGKAITFGYLNSGTGLLATITDPTGRVTHLYYSTSSDLTSIVDPTGATAFQADYLDAFHRVTNSWDRAGSKTSYAYGGNSLLCCVWAPTITVGGQSVRPYTYAFQHVDAALPANGKGTASVPSDRKIPADVEGYVADPRGNVTYTAVTSTGRPWKIRDALGRTSYIGWNTASQPIRTLSHTGAAVTYTWNGLDLVKVWDEVTGDTAHYEYGPYHQPTYSSVPGSKEWRTYDAAGTLASIRDQVDSTKATRYYFDATNGGRITKVRDPGGHETNYAYGDSATWYNLASVSTGVTTFRVTRYGYDAYKRVSLVISPQNDSTRTNYDLLNRVDSTTNPRGGVTRYVNGPLGVDSILDPRGQGYRFYRNALGWTTSEKDPLGWTTSYGYDANGNVVSQTDRNNKTITATYDALNRVSSRTADALTSYWRFDPSERWAVVQNATSTDSASFDLAGRLTSTTTRRGSQTYTIANAYTDGIRTLMTATGPWTGSRTVGYHYDALQRLDSLTDLAGGVTTKGYDDDGLPVNTVLPSGLNMDQSYTSAHLNSLSQYTNLITGQDMPSLGGGYALNSNGFVSRFRNIAGDEIRDFTYDRAGQLTNYTDSGITSSTYNCPGTTNRTFTAATPASARPRAP